MSKTETSFAGFMALLFTALLFLVIADSYQEFQCRAESLKTPATTREVFQLCRMGKFHGK